MNQQRPLLSRRNRVRIGQLLVMSLVIAIAMPVQSAVASANLLSNGGLETLDNTGFPVCWSSPAGATAHTRSGSATPRTPERTP